VSKLTRVKIIQWCTDLSELLCTDADDEAEVHELRDLALAALERGPGWRSMEGAPKDGSLMLLWDADREGCSIAFWLAAQSRWVSPFDSSPDAPTVWMPLPKPPEEVKL
jgi:hypothetical protein